MIRTRFAPSPTGYLHIGGVRTALYSWLFAKANQGKFILRIEDTDLERSTVEATDAIVEGMSWLGLTWDEGPYYQSQRFEKYNFFIDKLISENKAYKCYASKDLLDRIREEQMAQGLKPRYDATHPEIIEANRDVMPEMPHVIRFRNPKEGIVTFIDHVRGQIEVANSELDDLIIRRTDGTPTYNFCVVIDDWEMEITHVIRGEDHINNTPRQINIYHALGAPIPEFAHCAMILGDDGAKLSKRHGAVNVMQYRDDGFLPKAILNYLVRLGWSHGDQEIFSQEEMMALFSIDQINKAPSAFNTEKLLWLNNHYLKTEDPAEVAVYLQWHLDQQQIQIDQGPDINKVITLLAERCQTLVELATQSRYFYHRFDTFDPDAAKKHLRLVAVTPLQQLKDKLSELKDEEWRAEVIHQQMNNVLTELDIGMGKLGMPLRVAVTGAGQSPSIDAVVELLGKAETLARINLALEFIAIRAESAN